MVIWLTSMCCRDGLPVDQAYGVAVLVVIDPVASDPRRQILVDIGLSPRCEVEQRVRKDEPDSVVGFKPCSLALIGFIMMGSFSLLILLLLRENLDECRLATLVSFTGFPSSHQESQREVEAQGWRSIVRSVSILIVMLISSFQWLTCWCRSLQRESRPGSSYVHCSRHRHPEANRFICESEILSGCCSAKFSGARSGPRETS